MARTFFASTIGLSSLLALTVYKQVVLHIRGVRRHVFLCFSEATNHHLRLRWLVSLLFSSWRCIYLSPSIDPDGVEFHLFAFVDGLKTPISLSISAFSSSLNHVHILPHGLHVCTTLSWENMSICPHKWQNSMPCALSFWVWFPISTYTCPVLVFLLRRINISLCRKRLHDILCSCFSLCFREA